MRDATEKLNAAGLKVGLDERDTLISKIWNLLVLLCSGERAQRLIPAGRFA